MRPMQSGQNSSILKEDVDTVGSDSYILPSDGREGQALETRMDLVKRHYRRYPAKEEERGLRVPPFFTSWCQERYQHTHHD